jgi:hypothetical protein
MTTTPYDILMDVINAARTRLNDEITTLQPIGGRILKNTQPFTQQVVNDAWRKLQEFLANLGYTGLKQETIFANVSVTGSSDPAAQAYINYAGYYDGTTLNDAPVLPQNLIRPYELWERPYNSGSPVLMTEMDLVVDGLPAVPKAAWNRLWEWRDDTLYIPGATVATDLRLRFMAYIVDFEDIASDPGPNQVVGPWFVQPVPILRCLDSFADYVCREFCIARVDAEGAMAFQGSAEKNAMLVLNRDSAQGKSIFKSSEFGKMADKFTPAVGPDTQPVKR